MRRFPVEFIATILCLGSSLLCVSGASKRPASYLAQPLATIPATIGPWTGKDNPELDQETLTALGASSYLARTYRSDSENLNLLIAYYAQQRAGESMHSPKNCLPGSGWEPVAADTVEVKPRNGKPLRINKYTVQKGSQRVLVLYWYQNQERVYASEYDGKLFLIWDALTQGHTAGSIVRITTHDQPQALQNGVEFAAQVIPQIHTLLTGGS